MPMRCYPIKQCHAKVKGQGQTPFQSRDDCVRSLNCTCMHGWALTSEEILRLWLHLPYQSCSNQTEAINEVFFSVFLKGLKGFLGLTTCSDGRELWPPCSCCRYNWRTFSRTIRIVIYFPIFAVRWSDEKHICGFFIHSLIPVLKHQVKKQQTLKKRGEFVKGVAPQRSSCGILKGWIIK